ncbi:polysaccharide deacetylase family protein [Coleofasciculus sp. FACHB-1120]|uniref:polysaccharide deacetylase family protein n=1 Tax=Coleofasciculus sp. FACHB-1120 TaxID=2692783 RepID=UPI001F548D8B|nr:polysaccharide deacetylase family protein [Coleofasciculus sp. FACHB-1120]
MADWKEKEKPTGLFTQQLTCIAIVTLTALIVNKIIKPSPQPSPQDQFAIEVRQDKPEAQQLPQQRPSVEPETSSPREIIPPASSGIAERVDASRSPIHLEIAPSNPVQQLLPIVEPENLPSETTPSAIALPPASEKTFPVPIEYQGKTIYRVTPKNKIIALTFDDGPWGKTTLQVLDILKKNNIKATFFWVGEQLQSYPAVAQRVVAEGHAIGNHTWHHSYRQMDEATAAREIDDTAALIYKTTGVTTAYFRPPGGNLQNGLAAYAQKNNYAVMMWSINSADSRRHRLSAPKLVKNILKSAFPGSIVLMHDGGGNHSTTVQALPQIVEKLKKQGYEFVTLPELLQRQETIDAPNSVSTGEAETQIPPLLEEFPHSPGEQPENYFPE